MLGDHPAHVGAQLRLAQQLPPDEGELHHLPLMNDGVIYILPFTAAFRLAQGPRLARREPLNTAVNAVIVIKKSRIGSENRMPCSVAAALLTGHRVDG